MTYAEKITSQLREVYEKCREAIAKYERPVSEAVEKKRMSAVQQAKVLGGNAANPALPVRMKTAHQS